MTTKSRQLQIRVTPREKATIKRLAAEAGVDVSTYVLARALPENRVRFRELIDALGAGEERSFVLAELNDLLSTLTGPALVDAVEGADVRALPIYEQNYVAAMVELAASRNDETPPAWAREVEPLEEPHFAAPFASLRPHLLRSSPVPFKRRNIFVDASLDDRV